MRVLSFYALCLIFQLPKLRQKLLRQRTVQLHHLAGAGVDEPQTHRVEALSRQTRYRLLRAVHRVPQNRVADIGHVYPDLMGASRLQTAPHMGHPRIPGDDLPVGHSGPSPGNHRHLLPIRRVPSDGRVHRAAVRLQVAHHQTLIRPRQRVIAELGAEPQMGGVVLGGDDETAGVPVNAVNDAGTLLPADAGQRRPAVVEQGEDARGAAR